MKYKFKMQQLVAFIRKSTSHKKLPKVFVAS